MGAIELEERFLKAVRECCGSESAGMETELAEVDFDSLSFLTLAVLAEDECGLVFGEEDLNLFDYRTVGDVFRRITEK